MKRPELSPFRRHWSLSQDIVFLNHGSFGACPIPIQQKQAELRAQMEAEPVQFLWRHYEERLEPSRRALAEFLGAHPRDLVFVNNATTGVNSVVRSIRWQDGDEILTTSCDYNACRNALVAAVRGTGAKVVVADIPFPLTSDDEIVDAILRAVTPRTRLAMIDHVTSNTALIFPIERIVRELEARGIDTLVDGAHAPGMCSLNLSQLNAAYFTGNLHKWVCAPKGAAFLWAREDRQTDLLPAVVSHGLNRKRPGFTEFQNRFDWAGTLDPSPWFCVGDAIRWMGELLPGAWAELHETNHRLVLSARNDLCAELEVEPPCPDSMLGSMATLPLPPAFQTRTANGKIDDEQLWLYDRFGIEVPFIRLGAPAKPSRWFRISAQIYNTPDDYGFLAQALKSLA